MGKPAKPVTFTLTGTSAADDIRFVNGDLSLNGVENAITAGATRITLVGGDGNDRLLVDAPHISGTAPVFYDGGRGVDTIDFSSSLEAVAVHLYQGPKGASQPYIATGFTMISFVSGPPGYYDPNDPQKYADTTAGVVTNNLLNFENVVGSPYDDYLNLGTTVGARADGGAGNDYINGWSGNDVLIGGTGDDFLFGKGGNDVLTGGSGADQFMVLANNGQDVVTDFNPGEGDWLFYGWQTSADSRITESSWHATTYVDAQGVGHQAIIATFSGGSITLIDLTMNDVSSVMTHLTSFDWFA